MTRNVAGCCALPRRLRGEWEELRDRIAWLSIQIGAHDRGRAEQDEIALAALEASQIAEIEMAYGPIIASNLDCLDSIAWNCLLESQARRRKSCP
jgi:hypothetical protein